MAHTIRAGGSPPRHRRLVAVLEGLLALAMLCVLIAGGAGVVTLLAVRLVARLHH
jgi:hypothetical protein